MMTMMMLVMLVMLIVMMVLIMLVMTVVTEMVMVTVVMTTAGSKLSLQALALCQAWRWSLYIQSFLSLLASPAGVRTIVLHVLEPLFISSEYSVPPHSPSYL